MQNFIIHKQIYSNLIGNNTEQHKSTRITQINTDLTAGEPTRFLVQSLPVS